MSSTEKEVQEPEIKVQNVKGLEDKPKDQDLEPCGWWRDCSSTESEGENWMRSEKEKRCKKKIRKQKPKNCKN